MVYTNLTKKAMKLAYFAHLGQVDKSGIPYIYHPIHLAEQMTNETTTCIALLHDVVEDTKYTFKDLQAEGFNNDIINALKLLTHDKKVPYIKYIKAIAKNPLACEVKLADLRHNSDVSRLNNIDAKTLQRCEKYKQAIAILEDAQSSRKHRKFIT